MDRNALLMEEARARHGLRTLAYIHPQTGLALPATTAGSAGLAALQGFQVQSNSAGLDTSTGSAETQISISGEAPAAEGFQTEKDQSATKEDDEVEEKKRKRQNKKRKKKSHYKIAHPNEMPQPAGPEMGRESIGSGAADTPVVVSLDHPLLGQATRLVAGGQTSIGAMPAAASSASVVDSADANDRDMEDSSQGREDPEAPKRPMSAFLAFSNKRRKSLKRQYPCATNADLSKMLAKTWREAPEVIREKYLNEAAALSDQYKVDIMKWREDKKRRKLTRSGMSEDINDHNQFVNEDTLGDEFLSEDAANPEDDESQPGEEPIRLTEGEKSGINRTISSQILGLFEKNKWDAVTLATRVIDLCRIYEWGELESATLECYNTYRNREPISLIRVINGAEALEILRAKIPSTNIQMYREAVAADFVEALESLHSRSTHEENLDQPPFHTLENIGIVVRMLFELGTATQFLRIEDWASEASLDQLYSLDQIFARASTSVTTGGESAAGEQCVKTVGIRYKALKIEDLKKQREELIAATHGGEPRFSWCMPRAETESLPLTSFLRSSRKGPTTVTVGGGREFARRLATKYRLHLENRDEMLLVGFSANIQNASDSGDKASVIVTKTQDLHTAEVERYRNDMVTLGNVCVELRSLGVQVALLGTAEAKSVAVNVDGAEMGAASRSEHNQDVEGDD